ncbi:HU family DNA-binding protein [Bacteroides ihuae]|uniref:HU family DNA-binding protein n=1 Tax=Bacteroides ihuae TaxID=1852362 RepID=UPI0008D9E389|nr:HU family DNA-binding protein [Bacteroides ihuae]
MPINYVVRKKIDKSGKEPKVLYYAAPKALQKAAATSLKIANKMAERSALTNGDALSVLTQLPDVIASLLQDGQNVTIKGLGTFYAGISSEGVETPEECTAKKVWVTRICFKADANFANSVKSAEFVSMERKFNKSAGVKAEEGKKKKSI